MDHSDDKHDFIRGFNILNRPPIQTLFFFLNLEGPYFLSLTSLLNEQVSNNFNSTKLHSQLEAEIGLISEDQIMIFIV